MGFFTAVGSGMGKLAERRHSLVTDFWDFYPELQPLRGALAAGDWPTTREFLLRWDDADERAIAGNGVTDWPGSETMLARAVDADPQDMVAKALLGARTVVMGWEIRSARTADGVSRERFEAFHDHVRRADVMFREALAHDPAIVWAGTWRIAVARALSMGQNETMRRWTDLAAHWPHLLAGQAQTLQGLLPKWGGDWDRAWEFVVECTDSAPPGARNGVLVAEYHLEKWLDETYDENYLPAHRDDLIYAADRSVLHPDYRRGLGWVAIHNRFAMVLSCAGEFDRAARVFDGLENRVTEHPWDYKYMSPTAGFVRQLRRTRAATGTG